MPPPDENMIFVCAFGLHSDSDHHSDGFSARYETLVEASGMAYGEFIRDINRNGAIQRSSMT